MDSERKVIIIVDDEVTNLAIGKNNLASKFDVFAAPSGKKLFHLLQKVNPAVILLDIEMPEMNGFEVIQILKSSEKTSHIPVIFLTGKIDPESEAKGLSLGAVDYITKPFSRELLIQRIDLHITIGMQKDELMNYNRNLEAEVSRKTKAVLELQNVILKTIAELVECRDSDTGGHIERTQIYLSMLVDFLVEHGAYEDVLSSWDISLFLMSSQLHDLGKIAIKDDILRKPGKLTPEEFHEMKKHASFGAEFIQRIQSRAAESEFLYFAGALAGSHHEKWNGSGYPNGLKGDEIPLPGRLMAIVDVYDALTNQRPYKEAFTHETAIEIIREGNGIHFDPVICDIFLAHEKEFKNIAASKPDIGIDGHPQSSFNLASMQKIVSKIVDIRSGSTEGGHTADVKQCLTIFIDAMSKREECCKEVADWNMDLFLLSAQLHDIGKLAIKDQISGNTDALMPVEIEDFKAHTDLGIKIIQQMKENVDDESMLLHAEAASSHHEKWDGTGYPAGLKGKGIPLQGRIMAIVDVYVSLVNDSPQREKKSHSEAVKIIMAGSGSRFDPELVEIFVENEKEFEQAGALQNGQ
jgi:putative two-component system response regulator